MKFTKDVWIRTLKTFAQVFLGTLIPALLTAFASPPEAWSEVLPWIGSIFTPQLVMGDCLSAAICAVWNGIMQGGQENGK